MKHFAHFCLCSLMLARIAAAEGATEYIGSSAWQERRLFEPTTNELQRERRGHVFIYDGVLEADVSRVMDEEFERIDSMMFIRTKKPDPIGEVVAYDDDC